MNINNESGQKYLSEVKRHLKCSAATRNQFLETLKPELHNFELETPNASYGDYIAAFGDPKAAAQRYMDELSDREVFGYWKPVMIAVIVAALAILALMIGYFVTHRKMDNIPIYHVSASDAAHEMMEQSAAAEE